MGTRSLKYNRSENRKLIQSKHQTNVKQYSVLDCVKILNVKLLLSSFPDNCHGERQNKTKTKTKHTTTTTKNHQKTTPK